MNHEPNQSSDANHRALAVVFYVLAVVLTAAVSMTIRVESLGFFFSVGALFPLAFMLCLLGPNGPLRMGLAMMVGMVIGWSILNPVGAFVMLLFGVVFANAFLIFTGALLGALLRKAIVGESAAHPDAEKPDHAEHQDEG